jgi:dipeptidyl aminopeptidase/acylaminoacyl peptidase
MESETPALAAVAWQRYLLGTESTASSLDDLRDPGLPPGADLVVVDLDGHRTLLARNVDTLLWQPSPTGDAVAFAREVRGSAKPTKYLDDLIANGGEWRVEVAMTNGHDVVTTGAKARDVLSSSFRWSADGAALAYLGYASDSQVAPSLYILNMRTDRVRAVPLHGLNASPWGGRHPNPVAGYGPPGLIWTATGALLVRGARMTGRDQDGLRTNAREDWWLISLTSPRRCLTCELDAVPQSLWPETGRKRFFGLAAGRLWEFDICSGRISELTSQLASPVEALISPAAAPILSYVDSNRTIAGRPRSHAVFLARDLSETEPYLIDLRSRAITRLSPPAHLAQLVSVGPDEKSVLYMRNDRSGLLLWRREVHSGTSQLLLSVNTFLSGIAEAKVVHFPYTSLDGKGLNAWLLLPPEYEYGRRYPMITFAYPTYDFSASGIPWQIEDLAGLSSESVFNMQIAAARGYAVLFPSIPVAYQHRSEVAGKVVNEVLPAVNAAVNRGYADPQRLAVWGMSYGGRAVYALVTATDRFRAAIASNAECDLVSEYGVLDARVRYSQWAQEEVGLESIIESGEANLGGPPWKQWLRYIDNSPIFSVNHIRTPLLITAGDLDSVPIQQSEECFRALVRQNRPVRLVRYWGEGHRLTNPENVRNYWWQIFRWLERYIPPDNQAYSRTERLDH